MNPRSPARAVPQKPKFLDLFCFRPSRDPDDEFWVVAISYECWFPPGLASFFDKKYGETAPTLLDFEDLDEYMTAAGATYEKRVSKHGSVQLVARDESADALAQWLATTVTSGIRRPGERHSRYPP